MSDKIPHPKRILIVDDHPIMRFGLARLIDEEPDLSVPWEAGTAREALTLLEQDRPDLVLIQDAARPLIDDDTISGVLAALGEAAVPGYDTWAGFLGRRVAPAMRTCRSVEERQANLSRKLTRATQLLRTWVDVEVERQNRDVLASMNNRARLQLRLQQTVEGLSVAAVSYYVVGLIGYLAKGTTMFGLEFKPELVTAASVPVVVVAIWLFVRRIRRSHVDDGQK